MGWASGHTRLFPTRSRDVLCRCGRSFSYVTGQQVRARVDLGGKAALAQRPLLCLGGGKPCWEKPWRSSAAWGSGSPVLPAQEEELAKVPSWVHSQTAPQGRHLQVSTRPSDSALHVHSRLCVVTAGHAQRGLGSVYRSF